MSKMLKVVYDGIPYFHPGLLLKEILEARGIEQKEFAQRTGFTEKHISYILTGKSDIMPSFAEKIAFVLDEDALTWVNMQGEFNTIKREVELKEELEAHKDILKKYPISDMVKYNLIPNLKEKWKQLKEVMSFFGVGEYELLERYSMKPCAIKYRKLECKETIEATAVLYRWGYKLAASQENIPTYNAKLLEEAIDTIRKNMILPFEEALQFVKNTLMKAGVIFIFTPKIKNATASGSCYKYKENPVIHLTYRNQQLDSFWFSLFHEIKHILDGDIEKEDDLDIEEKANIFAKNIIVSKDEWNDFYENNFTMTEKAIRDFAKRQKIPVACVIGRMQKEGYVSYKQFAKLKESADIKSYDGIAFE